MMQNMGFNAFNVREKKNSDIPHLSVGFGSMNQVPSRLRIISRSGPHPNCSSHQEGMGSVPPSSIHFCCAVSPPKYNFLGF